MHGKSSQFYGTQKSFKKVCGVPKPLWVKNALLVPKLLLYSDATEFFDESYENANNMFSALSKYINIFEFDNKESYELFPL